MPIQGTLEISETSCLMLKHKIVLLKKVLQDMAEFFNKCTVLAAEVASLRDTIGSLLKPSKSLPQPPSTAGQPKRCYAKVAGT